MFADIHDQVLRPSRRSVASGLAAAGGLAACGAQQVDAWAALSSNGPWLNTPPLREADLRGKVVLANIWTYTCINSLRPLPYVRAWADRYRERGLVIIGVHSPEFSFEHELPRVRKAVSELDVRYPVVLDNDFGIWRGLDNSAWPGFYFLDAEGRLRHRQFGEGGYDRLERMLQALLSEARGERITDPIRPIIGEGPQMAPDWDQLRSPETYLGYARTQSYAATGGLRRDQANVYRAPMDLPLNGWSLSGGWAVASEFAESGGAGAAIAIRFHARDVHLVMAPRDRPVGFRVLLDGVAPGAAHGVDIAPDGAGELRDGRMYQLIRQSGPVRDRTFRIEFEGGGARAFCFTFG